MLLNKLTKNKWFKYTLKGTLFLTVSIVLFFISIYIGLWGKIPTINQLKDLKQSQATEVLDIKNNLIGKYYIYDRQSIPYSDFPQYLIDALVATEDARFYDHHGIDTKSLFRVLFKTILTADESSGGGSTITLQLAKNLFGRQNYGPLTLVINKIKESIVAKRIEELYSKEEILTFYLNTVPFPDNTYGIESASLKFFNVHTKELNLSQAATLIGSLKANNSFNPRLFHKRSRSRRDVVINQMVKYGYLNPEEASKIKAKDFVLNYQHYAPNQGLAPYFRAVIKKQLDSILQLDKFKRPNGEPYNINQDGLKVFTTLDNTLQRYAEIAMRDHMTKLQKQYEKAYGNHDPWLKNKPAFLAMKKRLKKYKTLKALNLSEKEITDSLNKPQKQELFSWDGDTVKSMSTLDSLEYYLKILNAGLISIEPSTGEVRAYVGGIDYRFFQYDHVSQSKRQVGSTFKPIVYTAALENGMSPCTYFSAKAITYTDYDDWKPTNASESDEDNLNYSLEYALSHSVNTIAVKVLHETGIDSVISQAKAMGIKSHIEKVPSIALGSSNLKLIELAKAYTSFVNDSRPSEPVFITKIENKDGKVIASYDDLNPEQTIPKAYSDYTRQVMLEFLKATVNDGTAQRLRSSYNFKNDIAGKTGTTQDNKDGWFVGIMPNLVTVTWVGNDNQQIGFSNTSLGQGANSALPIFANYLQQLNADSNYNKITRAFFEKPSDDVIKDLDCEPTKKDNFLQRLFETNSDKTTFKKKKKKGILSWLLGKKD
ncbi:penicillin-binding protein 1A [Yeosuana aromativorans]|uniref:Penicillin-binding protein 1A n=1 Tax=Yeosuana aromativorans TaxID=288019 RepID=A0A8J3FIH0_9FLAO|nr:transglycosylase domain-containing protein [Yeosuana aromativorans]GGK25260.1 penicillin-binding protein 1A [Yeosuana aromativorans]